MALAEDFKQQLSNAKSLSAEQGVRDIDPQWLDYISGGDFTQRSGGVVVFYQGSGFGQNIGVPGNMFNQGTPPPAGAHPGDPGGDN